jgi:hypothetical protein
MAISLFQDSVEMFVWILIKEQSIAVKEGASFVSNLDTISKSEYKLPYIAKMHDLNKARIGFKHYGNLPAEEEAKRFHGYVEEFLRLSFLKFFDIDFDNISLADLIVDDQIRDKIKSAESLILEGNPDKAMDEIAIARSMVFHKLEKIIPRIDNHFRDVDRAVQYTNGFHNLKVFSYISTYLEGLREATLASLLHFPLKDFLYLKERLPSVTLFGGKNWQVIRGRLQPYDLETSKRALLIVINFAIRIELAD